jgi:hypothetical protein
MTVMRWMGMIPTDLLAFSGASLAFMIRYVRQKPKGFLKGLSLEMDLAFDDIYYSGRTLRRYINS